ncbi:uncharacterized protein LOC111868155 [Cryptotermes secundus]|uniref:uncharacterized protein LOC111868155 n=1 Tax=Cryptotermes secundus TaxID=105785 RepID=UPI000CD7C4A0|nr:uncharacterized protein LOC111868155 [Cryptotermes secundus]
MCDESLIELVREKTVLYDTSHPDYIRTKLKDEVWDEIGAELGSDGKTAKEQWRKLRERHREALRRQKMKKTGSKADIQRPWSYQHQMEFLIPYMKNRSTCTNIEQQPLADISATEHGAKRNEEDAPHFDQDEPEVGNCDELGRSQSDRSESPVPKRPKLSDQTAILRFIKTSEMRAKNRDELRKTILQREQLTLPLKNDALFHFFMSMYNTTKGLSGKYQRQVRSKVYEAVSQAEEEDELEKTTRTSSFSPSFSEETGRSSSSPATLLTTQYPEFFFEPASSGALFQQESLPETLHTSGSLQPL